eukprot:Rmarinus@m.16137
MDITCSGNDAPLSSGSDGPQLSAPRALLRVPSENDLGGPTSPVLRRQQGSPWLTALCVVEFDLNLGQKMEYCRSPIPLTDAQEASICFLSLPDTAASSFEDTSYVFRTQWDSQGDFRYGHVHFRAWADPQVERGFLQKAVVFITPTPYLSLFRTVACYVGMLYFKYGVHVLEAVWNNVMSWPVPEIGTTLSLPLAGVSVIVHAPSEQVSHDQGLSRLGSIPFVYLDKSQYSLVPEIFQASLNRSNLLSFGKPQAYLQKERGSVQYDKLPALFEEVNLVRSLHSVLAALWTVWEVLIRGEPLIIISPTPSQCSDAVLSVLSLIAPLVFCGDFRPYFTIHDSDFSTYSAFRRSSPKEPLPSLVLGVTNVFFLKQFSAWPHLLSVGKKNVSNAGASTGAALAASLGIPSPMTDIAEMSSPHACSSQSNGASYTTDHKARRASDLGAESQTYSAESRGEKGIRRASEGHTTNSAAIVEPPGLSPGSFPDAASLPVASYVYGPRSRPPAPSPSVPHDTTSSLSTSPCLSSPPPRLSGVPPDSTHATPAYAHDLEVPPQPGVSESCAADSGGSDSPRRSAAEPGGGRRSGAGDRSATSSPVYSGRVDGGGCGCVVSEGSCSAPAYTVSTNDARPRARHRSLAAGETVDPVVSSTKATSASPGTVSFDVFFSSPPLTVRPILCEDALHDDASGSPPEAPGAHVPTHHAHASTPSPPRQDSSLSGGPKAGSSSAPPNRRARASSPRLRKHLSGSSGIMSSVSSTRLGGLLPLSPKPSVSAVVKSSSSRLSLMSEFSESLWTKTKGVVPPEGNLLRFPASMSDRECSELVRAHFRQLTLHFLAPFGMFFEPSVPMKMLLSDPFGHMVSFPSFTVEGVLSHIESAANRLASSTSLTGRLRGDDIAQVPWEWGVFAKIPAASVVDLYRNFLKSPTFMPWFTHRRKAARTEFESQLREARVDADILWMLHGKPEVELVDLYLRIKRDVEKEQSRPSPDGAYIDALLEHMSLALAQLPHDLQTSVRWNETGNAVRRQRSRDGASVTPPHVRVRSPPK